VAWRELPVGGSDDWRVADGELALGWSSEASDSIGVVMRDRHMLR